MKKLISIVIIISILLCSTVVLAAENPSFDISLTASKTEANPGDEITVVLSIKNIKNAINGLWGYQAFIEWDNNVLETSNTSVEKRGQWGTPSFNPISVTDSNITVDSEGIETNGDVFAIKFKVKDNASTGINTIIKVKDFYSSINDEDVKSSSDASITISIAKKENQGNESQGNEGQNSGNQGNESQGNEEQNSGNQGNESQGTEEQNSGNQGNESQGTEEQNNGTPKTETKTEDTKQANSSIPQTGENDVVIISMILGAIVLGVLSYIGYRKYNNI